MMAYTVCTIVARSGCHAQKDETKESKSENHCIEAPSEQGKLIPGPPRSYEQLRTDRQAAAECCYP